MRTRPKLLFLAFYYPPLQSSGCVRAANVAQYLSRSGWDVSVVTPHPALWRTPQEPQRVAADMAGWGVRVIYTGHRWRCLSSGHLQRAYRRGGRWLLEGVLRRAGRMFGVDEMIGWYPEVERACAALRPGDIDLVMATGSPFGAFRVARRLASRLDCPYVLDYRDLWTGNPFARLHQRERWQRAEGEVLADCAAVTVCSPSMAEYLRENFGVAGKVHVVPNGYGPQDFEGIVPAVFGHFAIVYAGLFMPPKASAVPLMQALRCLEGLRPHEPWRFHYYGPHGGHVGETALRFGVAHRVQLHGVVPRSECLGAVRAAGVATVVASAGETGDAADRGHVPAKIYEAIGLGTPVLAVALPGSDVESIVRTAGRGAVFANWQSEAMAAYLAELMAGKVPPSLHPEAYSWPSRIRELDLILRSECRRAAGQRWPLSR